MFGKLISQTSFVLVLLLSLFLCMSACRGRMEEELNPSDPAVHSGSNVATVVYRTDSTEWYVYLITTGKLYAEAVTVPIPDPYRLPVRDEAQVLRNLVFTSPSGERFVTSDGYTFGMPSASVSKAGAKTKYSVLGLYIRQTIINIHF